MDACMLSDHSCEPGFEQSSRAREREESSLLASDETRTRVHRVFLRGNELQRGVCACRFMISLLLLLEVDDGVNHKMSNPPIFRKGGRPSMSAQS